MIDVIKDDLQEVRTLADKAFQKRIAPATLYRWIQRGANGHRLEAVKVGRKWFTTPEAFQEFFAAQTEAVTSSSTTRQTDHDDDRRADDVTTDELKAVGLL